MAKYRLIAKRGVGATVVATKLSSKVHTAHLSGIGLASGSDRPDVLPCINS